MHSATIEQRKSQMTSNRIIIPKDICTVHQLAQTTMVKAYPEQLRQLVHYPLTNQGLHKCPLVSYNTCARTYVATSLYDVDTTTYNIQQGSDIGLHISSAAMKVCSFFVNVHHHLHCFLPRGLALLASSQLHTSCHPSGISQGPSTWRRQQISNKS